MNAGPRPNVCAMLNKASLPAAMPSPLGCCAAILSMPSTIWRRLLDASLVAST